MAHPAERLSRREARGLCLSAETVLALPHHARRMPDRARRLPAGAGPGRRGGAAAMFLATTGHPAVRAVAPLFAVWNTYADHFFPGGVLLNGLAESYDRLMVPLDHDRRDLLANYAYFKDPNFAGPQ